jgi:hypothetical protein
LFIAKAETCTTKALTTVKDPVSLPIPQNHVQKPKSLQEEIAEKPMISLASLSWPPDPLEEGLNALNDPLNRDEAKPLLRSELLAIGPSLRSQSFELC